MIPIILVAKNAEKRDIYLEKFISKNNFKNSNIFIIKPEKNEILLAQVKEIKKEITIISSLPRLIIFYEFEKASNESQNALLKSLEENNLNNQFILAVSNQQAVLPTISSRSKVITIDKTIKYINDQRSSTEVFLAEIEKSNNYQFLLKATLINKNKEEVEKILTEIIYLYRRKIKNNIKSVDIIKQTFKLKRLLDNNNLNPQIAYDNLLIFIKKAFTMKS